MKLLIIFLFTISLNADSLVKDKHGYYFASDRQSRIYFTKRQAAKVNQVLAKPNTIIVKHKYGKLKVAVNHYRVLSFEEIMDERDKELALLFSDKKK
jgi:hypothetical protein